MQLIRCSIDNVRPADKPLTVFWAWRDQEGYRHAYRQRLCVEHYVTNLAQLIADDTQERLRCPACGIDTEADYVPVFATIYVPRSGRVDVALPLCDPCSVRVKSNAEIGSESLPDRDMGVANPTPIPTAEETLAALGRYWPR
jgi:hypothetical protein